MKKHIKPKPVWMGYVDLASCQRYPQEYRQTINAAVEILYHTS